MSSHLRQLHGIMGSCNLADVESCRNLTRAAESLLAVCGLGGPHQISLCREAFAAWLPIWGVPFSYAVAIAYVLTDTADKGSKAYRTARKQLSENKSLSPQVKVPR